MLRQYQETLKSDILTQLVINKSVIAVLPTGGGKTRMTADVATHFNKVLWIAHRNELLEQARDALIAVGHQNFTIKSVFARPPDGEFDLLIVDEGHHESAKTFCGFIDAVSHNKLLSITATPYRLDRQYLNFDAIVYGASITDLTNDEFLVPIDLYSVRADKQIAVHWMNAHRSLLGKTILFVRNLSEAKLYKTLLDSYFVTEIVSGESDRKAQLHKFTNENVDILISCMVLTEGVDLPCTTSVVIARDTNSKGLLIQMVGRAMRPFVEKDHCNVVQIITNKSKSIANFINPRNHYISTFDGETWNDCRLGDRIL